MMAQQSWSGLRDRHSQRGVVMGTEIEPCRKEAVKSSLDLRAGAGRVSDLGPEPELGREGPFQLDGPPGALGRPRGAPPPAGCKQNKAGWGAGTRDHPTGGRPGGGAGPPDRGPTSRRKHRSKAGGRTAPLRASPRR